MARCVSSTHGVLVELRWREIGAATERELRLRGGKIVDMQDYEDARGALKALGDAA